MPSFNGMQNILHIQNILYKIFCDHFILLNFPDETLFVAGKVGLVVVGQRHTHRADRRHAYSRHIGGDIQGETYRWRHIGGDI
jgi:hypothetical protein